MKTEQEIFTTLESLCSKSGFLEVISYLCWRDTFIHQQGENIDLNDILNSFSHSKLSRTELSTLIGLMCKYAIHEKVLTEQELISNIQQVDTLMSDLHHILSFTDLSYDAIMNDPDLFKSGPFLREAIFYAGDGAYKHQYRDLAKIRYSNDNIWIKNNKGFSIDDVICLFNSIDQLQIDKANNIDLKIDGFSKIFQFTLSEISTKSNLDSKVVESIIDSFSALPEVGMESFQAIDDFNYRNAYPIIKLNDDFFISLQSYSLWESLYENPFFWFNADLSYKSIASKNRGQFTEDFSEHCLNSVFESKNIYKNINIHNGKDIVGEIDVLVIFGKYALVIQAKSKKLTIEARKGNNLKIKDDFKKAVHNAYDQALECCNFLQDPSMIFKQGNNILKLNSTQLENIFPICITSEYYPALAMQAREFLNIQTSNIIKHPFIMDVFLLDLITEMLDSPLLFLDFLEKRCDFGHNLISNHELTILSTYIKYNLYFENSPNLVMLEDSLSGELELAMLARRENLDVIRIPNGLLTLKDKYKYLGGLLNEVKYSDDFKKQKLGFLLLSLSEETLEQLNDAFKQMIDAFFCGKTHSDLSIGISHGKIGLTIHCNDVDFFSATQSLIEHCKMRKYSTKSESWIGLCYSPSEQKIRFLDYQFSKWVKNDEIEKKVKPAKKTNLTPNTFKPKIITNQNKRISRNDECPCGSGRKYKNAALYKLQFNT
ncbi:YecA family protein [Acinetobacter sp. ANC 4640]